MKSAERRGVGVEEVRGCTTPLCFGLIDTPFTLLALVHFTAGRSAILTCKLASVQCRRTALASHHADVTVH
jgi:hypothetical protein